MQQLLAVWRLATPRCADDRGPPRLEIVSIDEPQQKPLGLVARQVDRLARLAVDAHSTGSVCLEAEVGVVFVLGGHPAFRDDRVLHDLHLALFIGCKQVPHGGGLSTQSNVPAVARAGHEHLDRRPAPRVPPPFVGLPGNRLELLPLPRARPGEEQPRPCGVLARLKVQFEQWRLNESTKYLEYFTRLHRGTANSVECQTRRRSYFRQPSRLL